MKHFRVAAAFAVALAWSGAALAQTSPGLIFGQVPTAAQWNSYFTAKQDVLGFTPLNRAGGTMTGPLITEASTTSLAGFNIQPGTGPSVPNNGDLWVTASGLFVRVNGVTVGPLSGATTSSFAAISPIKVTFPSGIVTYAFDLTVANTFLAQQTNQGATTTQPGWYAQLTGDTSARVRVGLNSTDVPSIAFGPGNASRDLLLERAGPATLRLGSPDASAPIAQTIGIQNVLAGTSNTAGVSFTIAGSQGTGTGLGGSILVKTSPAGSSGSTQNALVTAAQIYGSGGIAIGSLASDPGVGNLNLGGGSILNNGVSPTGTGGYVRATSPALVTPNLGTPSAATLTNATGLPTSGLTGTLLAAQEPAHTGDMTNTAGSLATLVTKTNGVAFGPAATALLGQLPGTTANDNATAGNVGEYMISSCPLQNATVTITIASPAVVTYTGHGYSNTAPHADTCPITFTTSGALPTGLTAGTTYWVDPASITTNTFRVATSVANALAGTDVTTTGTQSGTQTGTADAVMATATAKNITGLALTAGDWDCGGVQIDAPAGSTVVSGLTAAINTTTDTLPLPTATGAYAGSQYSLTGTARTNSLPPGRFSLASLTNTFMVGFATFTTAAEVDYGIMRCRRVR